MENSKQYPGKHKDVNEPVEGHDFAEVKKDSKVPSSHGELANQKGSDFSELEESRMEHPPEKREENGSSKNDVDLPNPGEKQTDGVKTIAREID